MQDVRAFKVPLRRHAVRFDDDFQRARNLLANGLKRFRRLLDGPNEELALFALAVGIGRAVESAARRGHFAQDVIVNVHGNRLEKVIACDLPGMQIEPAKLRVVIEHLLKMRHEPMGVDAVTGESAADLIVNPAMRHLPQCESRQVERLFVPRARMMAQQEFETDGIRELGLSAETAVFPVDARQQTPRRLVKHVARQAAVVHATDRQHVALQRLMQIVRLLLEIVSLAAIGVMHGAHQLGK